MVLVEIMIPSMGRCYDFELEETYTVEVLIQEIVVAVTQKEHCERLEGENQSLSLYSQTMERRLPMDATLRQCGVLSGQHLILV